MWILRLVLVLAGSAAAAMIASARGAPPALWGVVGAGAASAVVWIEMTWERQGMGAMVRAAVFLAGGLGTAYLLWIPLSHLPLGATWRSGLQILMYGALGYLGLTFALKHQEPFSVSGVSFGRSGAAGVPKILDTSVVIDGRIAEVCDTGFLDGPLVVPRFVLQELQRIADSGDPVKRGRGRRALDILNRLQKHEKIEVRVTDRDFPAIPEVDEKLVALAREMRGRVVTNDFNLNKVAEFQNVPILNLNDLAGALKPAVLPGESMQIKIVKEGREQQQGIGYLEDGTMVVVENGRKLVGQTIEVVVASVVQTSTGRMMFARKPDGG